MRILFIEDDPIIAKGVVFNIQHAGIDVDWAQDLTNARELINCKEFNLVLSDLNLPDGNGIDFCRELRSANSEVPIIMMTARVHEEAVLEGFDAGANDYIKKPFSNKELVARVRANLPRERTHSNLVTYGDVAIKRDLPEIVYGGEVIGLSPSQHKILLSLMSNSERIITRESILDKIGSSEDVNDRTVDSHLSQLRRKLKSSGIDSLVIKSVYGMGYRIEKK